MRTALLLLLLPACFEYELQLIDGTVPPGPTRPADLHINAAPADLPEEDAPGTATTSPAEQVTQVGPPLVDPPEAWWHDPWSEPDDDDVVPTSGLARMTGGGSVDDPWGTVKHTLAIHCAGTFSNNQLRVDLGGGEHFVLETLDWAVCLDDPWVQGSQPLPAFNTVVGAGRGSLGAETADVWFRMVDGGEPASRDRMHLVLEVGGDVVEVSQALVTGNHQVHGAVGQP